MALNSDTTFPPSGPAPYRISRDWCIGDSLTYINANSENFDTRIETVSSLVLAVSSYAVGLSARSTPTVTLNFNNRTNILSAEVVNSSINTIKLGGDILQAGKTLLTAANINALVDVNTSAVTNGQALIWDSGTSQWTNQNIALGTVTDGDKGDIVVSSGSWFLKTTTNFEAVQTANIRTGAVTPAKLSNGGPWWQQTGGINLLGLNNDSPNAQLTVGSNLGGTAASRFLTVNGGSFSTVVGATTALASFGVNTAVNSPASLGIKVRRNSSTPDDYTSTAFGLTLDYANVSNVTQLWLRGDGNVGIGTNIPQGRLGIASATGEVGFNTGTSSSPERGNLWYDTDGSGWQFNIGKRQSGAFTSQITIQDNGDVGIGTTVPASRLTIEGGVAATAVLNALTLRNSQDGGVGLYFDNSTANNLASIEALVTSSGAGTDDGVLRFSTATEGTNTEKIRITSTGDVGIGTTSPTARLDVNGAAVFRAVGGEGGQIELRNPDNNSSGVVIDVSAADIGRLFQGRNNSQLQIGQLVGTGGSVQFFTAQTERMRIDGSGNVGIGTANPSYQLSVSNGTVGIGFSPQSGGTGYIGTYTNHALGFTTNNIERARIDTSGKVGINTTSPTTTLDVNGDIRTTNGIYLNYNQPTIYLQDSDHRSAMIHCNGNILHFLRGSGTNSTTWTALPNSQWPLVLNLENGDAAIGGNLTVQGINSGGTAITMQNAAGQSRYIYFNTANEADRGNVRQRFLMGVTGEAETGSNAGSNFGIYRYADDGSYLGNSLFINRASGDVQIGDDLNVTGTISGTLADGIVTPSKLNGGQSGNPPVYGIRAWVNFDGSRDTSGATNTNNTNRFIRSQGNISSVLRNGTGQYTITFTTAMPNTNYCVLVTAGNNDAIPQNSCIAVWANTYNLQTVKIGLSDNNTDNPTDGVNINVMVIC